MMEALGELEGNRIVGDVASDARQRWSLWIASFVCGFATLALLPLAVCAPGEIQLTMPTLAGVIVASLALGAGLRLHLRFFAERIGAARLRATLVVLVAWTVGAMGGVRWDYQLLILQFVVGVLGAAVVGLGAPGLPALLGAAATAIVVPALYRAILATSRLSEEGSWPMTMAAISFLVLAAAGISHLLARRANDAGQGITASYPEPAEMVEIPSAAAA